MRAASLQRERQAVLIIVPDGEHSATHIEASGVPTKIGLPGSGSRNVVLPLRALIQLPEQTSSRL